MSDPSLSTEPTKLEEVWERRARWNKWDGEHSISDVPVRNTSTDPQYSQDLSAYENGAK